MGGRVGYRGVLMGVLIRVLLAVGLAALAAAPVRGEPSSLIVEPATVGVPGMSSPLKVTDGSRASTIPEPFYLAIFGAGILLLLRRRG